LRFLARHFNLNCSQTAKAQRRKVKKVNKLLLRIKF